MNFKVLKTDKKRSGGGIYVRPTVLAVRLVGEDDYAEVIVTESPGNPDDDTVKEYNPDLSDDEEGGNPWGEPGIRFKNLWDTMW